MHKTMNKKKQMNSSKWKNFEIHNVKFEFYLFMFVIAMSRWTRLSFVSNMMESIAMC
jgi:Na+/citrate or Na+/malate symporter